MIHNGFQQGKTRWCYYQTAYHLVWIPKYRRKALRGEVQKELKALVYQCAERHKFTIIAIETDIYRNGFKIGFSAAPKQRNLPIINDPILLILDHL